MTGYAPTELAEQLASGLLSFPVTPFDEELAVDERGFRRHVDWLADHRVAGLFAAGGTGEFFSLTTAEVDQVVRAAVDAAPDAVPVLAPAGHSVGAAVESARAAESAGADGVLLFPPYLVESEQEGLAEYARAVCRATDLGVVLYNRANARYACDTVERLAEQFPNLIGFKDGVGDLEQMTRLSTRLGDRLTYIGGLPTAELFALPYHQLGMTTYSSAIFNFVPEFAQRFHAAVRADRRDDVFRMLDEFVLPYAELRDRGKGYAVSIVKAGLRATGRPAGPVRPPLVDLRANELAELTALTTKIGS